MKDHSRDLKSYITDVPDFPKKGIIFKDITSLLESPEGVKSLSRVAFVGAKK